MKQEDCPDQGRDVGIQYRDENTVEACGHSGADRLAQTQLFLDSLEDKDVGVNRHSYGQDDSSDSGQSQRRLKMSQNTHHNQQIEYQTQNGI